ncbi:XRE family transcriptional regulator [Roseivirga sp. BDSF3-8]|uniref:XRE family transcriptional regulator n=1 Tax=Roseivirga sp. BDSF3-8 TaxID=3241598 RepID=UPI00353206F6
MSEIFNKLRAIRKIIGLKQVQMAEQTGITQRDVSLLENGKKTFIPIKYIRFLNEKGIDLNWLFDDNEEGDGFYLEQYKYRTTSGQSQAMEDKMFKPDAVRPDKDHQAILLVNMDAMNVYPKLSDHEDFLHKLPQVSLPEEITSMGEQRMFQVEDDSMSGTLMPFDYAMGRRYDTWPRALKEGHVHIVVTDDEVLIRRVRLHPDKQILLLTPDNDNYPSKEVPFKDVAEMWHLRMKISLNIASNPASLMKTILGMKTQVDELRTEVMELKKSADKT